MARLTPEQKLTASSTLFTSVFHFLPQARDKQMARLTREEKLGKLLVRLSSGKAMPLSALRGSARVVIAAGTRAQVRQGVAGLRHWVYWVVWGNCRRHEAAGGGILLKPKAAAGQY